MSLGKKARTADELLKTLREEADLPDTSGISPPSSLCCFLADVFVS